MTAEPRFGPRLLTYRDAAKVLNVSERTLWGLCESGALPVVRFGEVRTVCQRRRGKIVEVSRGGAVRIDPRDLDAFVQRSKSAQAGGAGGSP